MDRLKTVPVKCMDATAGLDKHADSSTLISIHSGVYRGYAAVGVAKVDVSAGVQKGSHDVQVPMTTRKVEGRRPLAAPLAEIKHSVLPSWRSSTSARLRSPQATWREPPVVVLFFHLGLRAALKKSLCRAVSACAGPCNKRSQKGWGGAGGCYPFGNTCCRLGYEISMPFVDTWPLCAVLGMPWQPRNPVRALGEPCRGLPTLCLRCRGTNICTELAEGRSHGLNPATGTDALGSTVPW